jgi:hypothetical protein
MDRLKADGGSRQQRENYKGHFHLKSRLEKIRMAAVTSRLV